MYSFLVTRENLTAEQLRAVELNDSEHRLFVGGPGSGKTLVLLHRAKYLINKNNVESSKFRIFVFTKVLKEYIRNSLELLGLPDDCVTTFDSWCTDFYKRKINRSLPKFESGAPDFACVNTEVHEYLQKSNEKYAFDFVLIDEGQDLETIKYEMIVKLTKHVTVFMDHKQQIYDHGTSENDILKVLGLRRRSLAFLETYRCCPYIVKLAATFISDKTDQLAYLNQSRTEQIEKETPLLYIADNFDDEMKALADTIEARQNKGERIAVLVPQKRIAFGLAKGLSEMGLHVETPKTYRGEDNSFDFTTPYPKIMPYPSAKGLTFDSILLPRLTPRSFGSISNDKAGNMLFVAISRATKWAYMSTVGGINLPFMKDAVSLDKSGVLTIRRREMTPDLFNTTGNVTQKKSTKTVEQIPDVTDFF